MNATNSSVGNSLFVSQQADEVMTVQDVFEVFSQHVTNDGEETNIERGINPTDLAQYLQVRSIHETDAGVRVVVVTEFKFGVTTIVLEADEMSAAGFARG